MRGKQCLSSLSCVVFMLSLTAQKRYLLNQCYIANLVSFYNRTVMLLYLTAASTPDDILTSTGSRFICLLSAVFESL